MKIIIKYVVVPAIVILVSLLVAFLPLYFALPQLREIQCKELADANKIGCDHPYLAQGILLGVGTLFYLIVTTLEESFKGNKAKWDRFLVNQASVLIGFSLAIGFHILMVSSSAKLSPSFVDACKPDPPVSALCGSITTEVTKVNVTCTTHPTRWIPALSQGYLPMIALQTYLMITLIVWAIFEKSSDGIASLFIGLVIMGLLFGIGTAAKINNEVDIPFSPVMKFIAIGVVTIIYRFLVWGVLGEIKGDDDPQLPRHFDDPSPHLPNPELLQPEPPSQLNPAPDTSPPPSYYLQMNPAPDTSPPPSYHSLFSP